VLVGGESKFGSTEDEGIGETQWRRFRHDDRNAKHSHTYLSA